MKKKGLFIKMWQNGIYNFVLIYIQCLIKKGLKQNSIINLGEIVFLMFISQVQYNETWNFDKRIFHLTLKRPEIFLEI